MELRSLSNIGPKRLEALNSLGIFSRDELIRFYPRSYRDYTRAVLAAVAFGDCAVRLRVNSAPKTGYPRRGMSIVSARASDETGTINLFWFNQSYMARNIKEGEAYLFCGRVERTEKGVRMSNPSVWSGAGTPGIVPIYKTCRGLNQKIIRDAIKRAIEQEKEITDAMPREILERYSLPCLKDAILTVHFPTDAAQLALAKRRLALDDIIDYLLGTHLLRSQAEKRPKTAFDITETEKEFCDMLAFEPTRAQRRVIGEIAADMARTSAMNRLIQGDVGSGKTAVAFYAMYIALKNRTQCALMAPTELLARQHYERAVKLFGEENVLLLVGGMPTKRRTLAYDNIKSGDARIIIGTHALIQEGVVYKNLGLVIADEQHRFGVRQRAAIAKKAFPKNPDVLVLTATPIPRSLSLALFGDMDISVIDELPPGRKPVITSLVPQNKRDDMYDYIAKRASHGEQTYIVCPLVDESEAIEAMSAEELYARLCKGPLKDTPAALLHGRMRGDEKQRILDSFRTGETKVLVSTTVIEVGVDVSTAAAMVIESADRFGLAQLHQLRGRVGRGGAQARCFLCTEKKSGDSAKRLGLLCATNDGFKLAMEDLKLRGPGEFLGTSQSGRGEYGAMFLIDGMETLALGMEIANKVIAGECGDTAALYDRAKKHFETKLDEIVMN